ncbi:MAG TPA: glycosyltransferase [Cyclobacteriaceae bacterium]|nr:glycosyltransferase [Cyclobacteriaceae bacterium]
MGRKVRNIIFIIPEMSMGGAQRSLATIAAEMSERYNTRIVVFNRDYVPAYDHVLGKAEVLSLDVSSGPGIVTKLVSFIKRVRRLRRLKRQLDTDVAISFLEGADYVNLLSRGSEKVILSIRGSKVHDEIMRKKFFFLRRRLISWLYRRADAIVTVNEGIKKELNDHYKLTHVWKTVIYNFYDLDKIDRQTMEDIDTSRAAFFQFPVIAMSGRLAPEKGQLMVAQIFSEVRKHIPDARLMLIGDGPERDTIIRFCTQSGWRVSYGTPDANTPDVWITGSEKNVFKYLRRSTIYILNSSSEGFPNGLAEAMACGVPVMSADCPYGPAEILAPGRSPGSKDILVEYGLLMPMTGTQEAIDTWTTYVVRLLQDSELRTRLSRNGRRRIGDFSKDMIIPQWITGIEGENKASVNLRV